MFISVIIGFRNRELIRVERALNALANQSYTNFELIFIDYGSETNIAEKAESLVSKYKFAKYVYSDTRGFYWNRSHALNTGIVLAQGELIVISDIDLLLPFNYLESVSNLLFQKKFYTFSCYYLPETVNYSNDLDNQLEHASVNYVGLCAVLRKDLLEINCFDEYFMNWGGEDDDLYFRLEKNYCEKAHLGIDFSPVLHQWHPTQSYSFPTPWYLEMVNHLYSNTLNYKTSADFGMLVNKSERVVLRDMNCGCFQNISLFPNKLFQFNIFLDVFFKMQPGSCGQFDFIFPPVLPKGRKQRLVDKINSFLSHFKIPYKITKDVISNQVHTSEKWDDFLMYFIGKNRAFIQDYYILDSPEKKALFFQKK